MLRKRLAWRTGLVTANPKDQSAAMARSSVLLFVAGASLGLFSLVLPGDAGRNGPAILATSIFAYAVAGVPLVGFDRLPRWAFHLLTALGTVLISFGLYFGGQNAHVYGLLYFWVVIYVSYFFSWRSSALHLLLVGLAYAAVLMARTSPGLTSVGWVITIGTLAVAAALVRLLMARLAAVVDDLVGSEGQARESGDRLRALIEAAPVAIIELDADRCVRTWNGAAERIFGWSTDEVVGQPSPVEFDVTVPPVQAADPAIGQTGQFNAVGRRRDGEWIDVTLSTAPVVDHSSGQLGVMMIAADMTEQKQLEERLRHAHKMEAVGRLAGGIAHDFNNILLVVRSYAWLVGEGVPDDDTEQRENLAEIDKAVDRAAGLTRQLLTFSQRQVQQPAVVDLNALIGEMEGMLRPLIGEDVELIVDSNGASAPVMADATRLEQVIVNLTMNAREAMPDGGTLTITVRDGLDAGNRRPRRNGAARQAADITLTVTDTGVGIEPDRQRLIFEPFYTTKKDEGGSGLGLSTVYGIVDAAGGRIDVASRPGRGTTFTIRLPHAGRLPAPVQRGRVAGAAGGGSETVMLVEDEDAVREPLLRALEAYGYPVIAARDGEEALRLAEGHPEPIDLLITDVVMPAMSGPELVRRLVRLRPDVRILYMSGYVERSLELIGASFAGRQVGGDGQDLQPGSQTAGFLQKPFTPEELATKVRELLDSPARMIA